MKNKILSVFFFAVAASLFSLSVYANDGGKEKSSVVTLSASNYKSETAKGLVFVDFWAAWCGPCRRMAPILEEIAKEYKDSVKIGKLNVENYKRFAIDEDVQALPTIVVYKDGKEMERIVGLVRKADLVKVIEKYSGKE